MEAATLSLPVARVYSVDPWMAKQESGEDYRPAHGHVAIPAEVRRSEKEPIPLGLFPRRVMQRRDVFMGKIGRKETEGIFQRIGPGQLRILYLLKREKHTPERWDFAETVEKIVSERFEEHLRNER